jgi:ribosomal protein L11 methyltransferase
MGEPRPPNFELIEPFIEHQGERRFFWLRKPRPIGERLLLARGGAPPSRTGNRITLFLDFRSAFGTGGHGTTEGCLLAIERHLRSGVGVLDVGTGTGILALAALRLGAGRVTAVDIDRAACLETRRNLALNGIEHGIDVIEGGLEKAEGKFGLVVANLRTPILAELMGGLCGKVAEGGLLILSGILERELPSFQVLLERRFLKAVETRRIHGWMTLVLSTRT